MNSDKQDNTKKIKQIKAIYLDFQKKLNILKKEHLQKIQKIIKTSEEKQVGDIIKQIKNNK